MILVIGMHRSGTSIVAHMLHHMGCHMGDDLLAADIHNPGGYYEDRVWLDLNKAILTAAGGDWRKVPPYKSIRNQGKRFRNKWLGYIQDRQQHRSWGIKEPRLCLTAGLYYADLPQPVCFFVHRGDRAVADSLTRLYGKADWPYLIRRYRDHKQAFVREHHPTIIDIYYEQLTKNRLEALAVARQLNEFAESRASKSKVAEAAKLVRLDRVRA